MVWENGVTHLKGKCPKCGKQWYLHVDYEEFMSEPEFNITENPASSLRMENMQPLDTNNINEVTVQYCECGTVIGGVVYFSDRQWDFFINKKSTIKEVISRR